MQDEMNDLQETYTDPNPGDLVRVVRCEKCEYFCELVPGTKPICIRYWHDFSENDYCSKGARRNGN